MQSLNWFLEKYGESHQNTTNKLIQWVCVPSIMFSLFGLLMAIAFPFSTHETIYFNWAFIAMVLAWVYYLRLSLPMFFGFLIVGSLILWGNYSIYLSVNKSNGQMVLISIIIFALAWIGQFIGHKIEGKKPSFLEDLQFLLIGPPWLLHFIYQKIGIKF